MNKLVLFGQKELRRIWHNEQWYLKVKTADGEYYYTDYANIEGGE